jgi:hypothetical protein
MALEASSAQLQNAQSPPYYLHSASLENEGGILAAVAKFRDPR